MNTLPRIARNRDEFQNALFTGPTTFDGSIDRVLKGGIKVQYMSETYVLNRENVFCLATRQSDGRMWYSYGGLLNARLNMSERYDLACLIRGTITP